jgi:uncharacterized protein (TIGR02145 family)
MKNLILLIFITLLNNSFGQLAQWTHSNGNGWFIEIERKAANNQPIWQESGQFNYEELSRTESEVLLKDINGRSDMQVKITNNACYWKYPNDVNWNTLQSGSWTVKPILRIEENCTSSRNKYLDQNPDVKKAGLDPWGHYQSYGKKEGRKWPNCFVDFSEVSIGYQIWMNKNLNVDKFRNGDPIPEAKSNEEWQKANSNQQPAWCYYNNDPKNDEKYGKLYNWYAVNDPRGLAPIGWKVASDEDWKNLIANYSGNANAGSKLKTSNGAAFKGELSGFRNGTGPFVDLEIFGDFWTSLSSDSYNAVYYKIGANSNAIDRSTNDKPGGLSVRCIREMNSLSTNYVSNSNNVSQTVISTNSAPQTTNSTSQVGTASSSSPKPVSKVVPTPTFKTVQIGTQTWMAENLNVSTFRNGDPIPEVKTKEEWENAISNKQPAYTYNINDKEKKYGKYYNFYAATDPRDLYPIGWRPPTYEDFLTLIRFLGEKEAGKKLKSSTGWDNVDHVCNHCAHWTENQKDYNVCPVCNNSRIHGQHSGNGDNSSGFNAYSLPVDMVYQFGYKTCFHGKITGIHADLMGMCNDSDNAILLSGEKSQGPGSSNPSHMIFRLIKE